MPQAARTATAASHGAHAATARERKALGRQPWARLQIRMTVEALRKEGAPLADLTNAQIAARCCKCMREKSGRDKGEVPSTRSFERYLPGILIEVLSAPTSG